MTATFEGKKVVVVGGTSGIGLAVAKQSLLHRASHIVVASSTKEKIDSSVKILQAIATGEESLRSTVIEGLLVDSTNPASVKALFEGIGELDHLAWTSGGGLRIGFPKMSIEENKDIFDIQFWGVAAAAQNAKFRPGGSITVTSGTSSVKPQQGWSIMAGYSGAMNSLARGLAVDLAPVRVNVISPGLVRTERWERTGEGADFAEADAQAKWLQGFEEKLLVKHVANAEEVAEAYLFCMKCAYITGQTIEVDGGWTLA